MTRSCPACDSADSTPLLRIESVPVLANAPQPSVEAARAVVRADMDIGTCRSCGHVYNRAFDGRLVEYAPGYENSLMFSEKLRLYAEGQAADLSDRYALQGREVVELGCGDAAFLAMLAARGAHCTGYDPSAKSMRTLPNGVTIVNRDFSESVGPIVADLVVCRHMLEHVGSPVEFLTTLRRVLVETPQTRVFFEVPNSLSTLRDLAVWDLVFEHPSYFWRGSLEAAFTAAGFDVEQVEETFEGQFLTVHARVGREQAGGGRANRPGSSPADLWPLLDRFGSAYRERIAFWCSELTRLDVDGRRAAVWGAGTKGVMFLDTFRDHACLDSAVDVNPRKRGLFMTGSGRPIVAPEELTSRPPDAIVVMNPAYADEIRARLREMGIEARVLTA